MHIVKKRISGVDLNPGTVVDASGWRNVGALVRAGFLVDAPAHAVSKNANARKRRDNDGEKD